MIVNQLTFTQGDNAALKFVAENGLNVPINLTGATFQTFMQGPSGALISFPNGQHTADPDQINNTGQFTLTLSTTDTSSVGVGSNKEVITLITISGLQIYYHGFSILTVLPAVPNF